MRFVISEYISFLKEDQELDSLISELLMNMKITPIVKPEKGRQDGVDISAVGIDPEDKKEKLFLLVVKQGDITRKVWDSGQNSVRASLNEVFDVYLKTRVPAKYADFPKKVIVSSNGYLSQNVQVPWTQFTNELVKENLEVDFWGIDKLTLLCQEHFFAESLFPKEHAQMLNKTLVHLEDNEYDLNHFTELINLTLAKKESKRGSVRQMKQLNLCLHLIWVWGREIGNLKHVYKASEKLLLRGWKWLEDNKFTSDNKIAKAYHEIRDSHIDIGRVYFMKIHPYCFVKNALSKRTYNYVDYSLLVWEQIGIISSIGLAQMYEVEVRAYLEQKSTPLIETFYKNSNTIAEALYQLIDNNPPAFNPNYDEHCIEINLALCLFTKTGNHRLGKLWLKKLIAMTGNAYGIYKDFPLFYTNESALLKSHLAIEKTEVSSSILYTVLSEWCVIYDSKEDYSTLKSIIEHSFPELDLQMWYPEKDTYELLFNQDTTSGGSVQTSIELPDSIDEYKEILIKEIELYAVEREFEFYGSGFYFLSFLMSRHFRTYVFPHLWRKNLTHPVPGKENLEQESNTD